jgi:hypothetical protein
MRPRQYFPVFGSPDGAERNPGRQRKRFEIFPDYASLHPGYAAQTLAVIATSASDEAIHLS